MAFAPNLAKKWYENLSVEELEETYEGLKKHYCFSSKEEQIDYIIKNYLNRKNVIYKKINNNYGRIKIIKSKLIDSKTNELITDKLVIKDYSLEDLKLTINNEDKKYIIEKVNDNYVVTYVNSSLEDINKSYFSINNNVSFAKKLERRKNF